MARVNCRIALCAGLAGLLAALPAGVSRGAVGVDPAFVELRLDRGRPAGRFIISNLGETEERYRIRVVHFQILENGGLREVPPDGNSLAPYIRFNPKELTLPARTKRAVRFAVLTRRGLKPGEYWAAMELESLKTTVGRGADAGGRELKIEIVPTIMVPIFGRAGKVQCAGKLLTVTTQQGKKATQVECTVANTGTGRLLIRGDYEVLGADGNVVHKGQCGYSYVLPGARRRFVTDLTPDIPEGSYTIRVRYSSPQLETNLTDEAPLAYKKPAPTTQPATTTAPSDAPATGGPPAEGDDGDSARKDAARDDGAVS
jgi:hypothetical protein